MLRKYSCSRAAVLSLIGTAHLAAFAAPLGTAFTYQGRLQDANSPAQGAYDFQFRLFNAESGGTQVGSSVLVNDLVVQAGLFTTTLDFGTSVFTGEALWLDIGVRPGSSSGAYTLLVPRQALTAAPFALYSANGALWEQVGTAITNTNTGFVGVNRSSPITTAEYFGIQAPVASGYGGMYIATDGDARPFYGYETPSRTAWTYLDGATGNWYLYNSGNRVTVEPTGHVGINTTNPTNTLHVAGGLTVELGQCSIYHNAFASHLLSVHNDGTGNAGKFIARQGNAVDAQIFVGSSGTAVNAYTNGTGRAGRFEVDNASNSASGLFAVHNGTGNAFASVHNGTGRAGYFQINNTGNSAHALYSTTNGTGRAGYFEITNSSSSATALHATTSGSGNLAEFSTFSANAQGVEVLIANLSNPNPAMTVRTLNTSVPALQVVGTARVDVLEIVGADVAEKFPVTEEVKPGMVVMIDTEHPGQLCLAQGAYNRRVAGVVSGANGLSAGTVLGHLPGQEDAPPVALSGRVYVWCDAADEAIEVGDLLTTSTIPGHAMKASDPAQSHGAILGKAMTALPRGQRGLVLALVNLH